MKTATKRRRSNLRPKHKHTKEYLSHYYPFLPLLLSIGLLLFAVLNPYLASRRVLASSSIINPQSLLTATNSQRAHAGLNMLQLNPQLQLAAESKAEDMAKRNYWSHQTPEGDDPWVFIIRSGYSYQKAGENLAYGFDSSKAIITGWMNSPAHKDNILDATYQHVGFGIAQSSNFNNDGPATVVVALYGEPQTIANINPLTNILGQKQTVSYATILTNAIWARYLLIGIITFSVLYLVTHNSKRLKAVVVRGERFLTSHLLLDSIVISLLAISLLLLQSAGSIH